MSWLQSWLNRLFGKSTPNPSRPTSSRQSARPKTNDQKKTSENTLSGLLQSLPSAAQTAPGFAMPALSPEVLGHLRQHIHKIPPMPETWHKMQHVLQQENISASDLGEVISRDPVLTARILKTSNSSAYASGTSPEISNISLAIARLGLDETINITFQTLAPELNTRGERHIQMRHIWMHCQALSALMRLLSEGSPLVNRHDASLIGMLHDIGKLVILHIEPWEKLQQLQTAIAQGDNALQAESHILGYTHIDAGMMLALHWQLPKQVQHYINFHHHPDSLRINKIGERLRHPMLLLQLAHLLLQQFVQDSSSGNGIWQSGKRQMSHEFRQLFRREIDLPMDSPVLYAQLAEQVSRIEQQFPDLFTGAEKG